MLWPGRRRISVCAPALYWSTLSTICSAFESGPRLGWPSIASSGHFAGIDRMLVGVIGLSGNQLNASLDASTHVFDHLGVGRGQRIQFSNGLTGSLASEVPKSRRLRIQSVNHVFPLTLTKKPSFLLDFEDGTSWYHR